jgi:hypothetical protein
MVDVPDTVEGLGDFFEGREKGGRENLLSFLKQAKYKYDVGMADFVQRYPIPALPQILCIYRVLTRGI